MKTKRRKFKSGFKTNLALEAINVRKTLAQLTADFSLHPNQISQYLRQAGKQTLLSSIEKIFEEEKAGKTT